ncbi:Do family serine endopeptidase AlgW [Pseudomonas sp. QL9]|uniref:Serine endoprotease DegS n=1 Tax=Pseudomonas knackmussii (strain DSM 6978 / CCUG 54928 / LMG 23759 / B13) TaxID=1301098 RepID=A0A024HLF5_PSEKB|nr:Do family serine endopeptidase AlgW [Pseudomonas knackmussii]CDF85880.1 Serine endoprotease DegS [Pseudomonas knackmussii B13]
MLKALRFLGWPALVGVLLALLIIQRNPEWVGLPQQEVHLQQAPLLSRIQQGPVSYADAVTRAAPAVANLYTTKMVSKPTNSMLDDPLFRRFFGDNLPQQKRMESSLGSAVIMSPEGYLLTNNHVTAGADQIVVALRDGRETTASLVGSDPETDLAVLKIDLKDLPVMTLGRSDGIRTGDVCLAIGNPFGVGQTVTMGIISATGRNQLGLNTYEDFIQTDAAINPGNSGGALVDANGNLIGINTAIFSKSGGSQGIGFAIPVKLAIDVMQSIIEHGQVIRGWLGVEVQPLTPELAESFGLQDKAGIVVAGVYRDGPASRAGMLPGDIILSIDGEPASDGRKAMNQVARTKPNQHISIEILRNGKHLTLQAEVGLRPPPAPNPQQQQQ